MKRKIAAPVDQPQDHVAVHVAVYLSAFKRDPQWAEHLRRFADRDKVIAEALRKYESESRKDDDAQQDT